MEKSSSIFFWIPRIVAILFIVFVSIFALDVFHGSFGMWGFVAEVLLHLIFSCALIALLATFWKRERVLAASFFILAVIYYVEMGGGLWRKLPMAGLFCLVGLLFLLEGIMKKKAARKKSEKTN